MVCVCGKPLLTRAHEVAECEQALISLCSHGIDIWRCAAVQPRMTLARTLKLYKLPEQPVTEGLRPLEPKDVPKV